MRFQLTAYDEDPSTTLRSYLNSARTRRTFGKKVFLYLRDAEIRELTSDQNINMVVSSETRLKSGEKYSLKGQIRDTARKTFLIAIAGIIRMHHLFEMTSKGLRDVDLNLPLLHEDLNAYRECFVFERFQNQQRWLIPPILSDSAFLTYGDGQCVPIEREESPIPTSSERCVYRACVETDYHEISTLEQHADKPGLSKEIAIMELRGSSTTQQRQAGSQLEFVEFLASHASHEHIIKPYGRFALQSEYPGETAHYIISELPHGYLSGYFASMDPPTADEWIREQIRGLAAALASIHTTTDGKYGIHHDIRPRMIAIRQKNTGDLFKLALSEKSKVLSSYAGPNLPGDPTAVSSYHAPELSFGQSPSRCNDIWSLGCVFLEIMVWYTEGRKAHAAFRDEACGINEPRHWFLREGGETALQKVVKQQLNTLQGSEQRRWVNLVLVMRRMLATGATSRIIASELVAASNSSTKPI